MPISYVEEIAVRYLMKNGYLVSQNIWFQPPKQKTGRKVAGWTDIDIFAVKPNERALILQCKSYLGTEASGTMVSRIVRWFENAIDYLRQDSHYEYWVRSEPRKILVVDVTVMKAEKALRTNNIEVWHYNKILKDLLNEIYKEEKKRDIGRIGKVDDILLRVLAGMIRTKMIAEDVSDEENV